MTQKSVVVTGGNRGIGLSITESFVDAGYFVVVGARNDAGVSKRFGDKARFVSADVRKESSHRKLADAAVERTGALDCWVNNAGYSAWKPIGEIDDEFLGTMLDTNLKGVFWGCKAAAAAMKDRGVIINISSLAGKRGTPNNSAYCASKFAVNGMTQALTKELGPRGIRINAICPVLIATEGLVEALGAPHAPAKGDVEGFLTRFAANEAALRRLPKGSEVGAMCVFLASDEASAVTGQCMNVDCGVLPG